MCEHLIRILFVESKIGSCCIGFYIIKFALLEQWIRCTLRKEGMHTLLRKVKILSLLPSPYDLIVDGALNENPTALNLSLL